ncbi:alpha-isopropylmalate synthase regulatory domain-containing protein [Streptomyces sp. NPDC020883]|uniref:alpha-isopropylmalate synthase regulatory domain-containing protein n=1 Tax=Streptomyces sp. NPDC020883 TaxID=3365099 RepID=UPI0037916A8C
MGVVPRQLSRPGRGRSADPRCPEHRRAVTGRAPGPLRTGRGGGPADVRGAGNGPLAAFADALAAAGHRVDITAYAEHATATGPDSAAVAYVRCRIGRDTYWGAGQDTSVRTASVRAVPAAVNRAARRWRPRIRPAAPPLRSTGGRPGNPTAQRPKIAAGVQPLGQQKRLRYARWWDFGRVRAPDPTPERNGFPCIDARGTALRTYQGHGPGAWDIRGGSSLPGPVGRTAETAEPRSAASATAEISASLGGTPEFRLVTQAAGAASHRARGLVSGVLVPR